MCEKRPVKVNTNPSSYQNVPIRADRSFLGRIIGIMAVVFLLGGSACGEFVVKPIIMKKQVQPNRRGVPLGFQIEYVGGDQTEQLRLRLVDLGQSPEGLWVEIPSAEANTEPNAAGLPSCRHWLTCPADSIEVKPRQSIPITITADVPSDADGIYYAALIVESTPRKTQIDGFTSMLTIQYLVPILLDVQGPKTSSGEKVSGRVVDPDGRPVAGAQVALTGNGLDRIMLCNGILKSEKTESTPQGQLVETDADGRFCFEGTWSHPFYLFAAHAVGFAPVIGKDFQKNHEIRLERWGRVEGQVTNGLGGTDHRIWMMGLPRPASVGARYDFTYDTPCGADGRFVFERVPTGWFNVGYLMAIGDGFETLTERTAVVVKGGGTAKVKVGGEGRPVVGRFVLPASFGRSARFGPGLCVLRRAENIERNPEKLRRFYEQQLYELQLKSDPYAADAWARDPRTDNWTATIEENRREWYLPWYWVDDDADLVDDNLWNDVNWRGYAFCVSPDGSFRIEDVVPGRYEVSVTLAERREGEDFLSPFAQYHGTIELPPTRETHTDKPFDIGTLKLDVFGVGEPAPLFEGKTFQGDTVRLTDFRGKFVLVSFSPDESDQLMEHLKELQKTYGGRGDLQIIAINHVLSMEELNAPVVEGQIKFIHCDDELFESLLRQYQLFGSPNVVLVDPQGRIAATHLLGLLGEERLMRTVREAIDHAAPSTRQAAIAREAISGRVLDPNGRPVAGAQVALTTQTGEVLLHNAVIEKGYEDAQEVQLVQTDIQGRFSFEGKWPHPFYLFAAHEAGFASMIGKDFESSRELRLERWGRIEGKLVERHQGLDPRVWMLGLPSPAWVKRQCDFRYDTACSEDGRFVFEKVPPGWFNIGHLTKTGEDSRGLTSRTAVVVKAGETTTVTVGGKGRRITGRFIAPASYGRSVYFGAGLRVLRRNEGSKRDSEKVHQLLQWLSQDDPYGADVFVSDPRMEDYVVVTEDGRQEWDQPWYELQDSVDLADDAIFGDVSWRSYAFEIDEDGSFEIEDVAPGKYDLSVDLEEKGTRYEIVMPFARYRGAIEVPPEGAQPLDIGTLTLDVFGVGDPAPLFEIETVDGTPIRLIDQRGKFVLLCFSSPDGHWELNGLKQLHETYGSRGDLQVIELIHEPSLQQMKQYIAQHAIEWPVFRFEGSFDEGIAARYRVPWLPYIVLVDPEGKIAAVHLRDERLTNTVREAIDHAAPSTRQAAITREKISGRVLDPGGRPAAGVQVGLNTDDAQIAVHNGILELDVSPMGPNEWIVETDADGRFDLGNMPSDSFFLFVAGDRGFALMSGRDFKKSQEIRLEPWGRIEGQLAKGREGSDSRVWMMALPNPAWLGLRSAFRYDASQMQDGRFVFEKVPTGWFEVGYLTPMGDYCESFTSRTPVEVRAGKTARVRLGGQGRPVIGRFVPPSTYGRSVYFGAGVHALYGREKIDADQTRETPRDVTAHDAYTFDAVFPDLRVQDYCVEIIDNHREWFWREPRRPGEMNSYKANAPWRDTQWRGYAFRIHSDGSFRIEDVVPGVYDMRVELEEKDTDIISAGPFAEYRGTIQVPAVAEVSMDQPVDLGDLELDVYGVGDPAPLFEAETVDGKTIRLTDFRGKFVLLCFWDADICTHQEQYSKSPHAVPGYTSDLRRLKELHDTYGTQGNLQVIGVNQFDSLETIKEFVTEHRIEWPEIRYDTSSDEDITRYIELPISYPYIVFVDPEGKIAAVHLRDERLTNTVRDAIDHAAPSTGQTVPDGPGESGQIAHTLDLRVALTRDDLEPGVVEECYDALAAGQPPADGRYLWVPVRPGTDIERLVITHKHGDRTWLLVRNEESFRLIPVQGWHPKRVNRDTLANGKPVVMITLDPMGRMPALKVTAVRGGKPLAQILDGNVVSVLPIPKEGGISRIAMAGNFTEQELDDLAAVLQAAVLKKEVWNPPVVVPKISTLLPRPPTTAGKAISGRVVDPNGRSVAGAQVALMSGTGLSARIDNGVLKSTMDDAEQKKQFATTDSEGRFLLWDTSSDWSDLIAVHEVGFTLVAGWEFSENHEIRLQRWGRIEGQLAKGRGGPACRIVLTGLPNPTWLGHIQDFTYDTRCDEQRRFVFERVPSGWFQVGYMTAIGDDYENATSLTPVAVKAGETTTLKLGGEGRPVIGRFAPPASHGEPVYFGAGVRELRTHWPYPSGSEGNKSIEWDQKLSRHEVQLENPTSPPDVNWPELPLERTKYEAGPTERNRRPWHSQVYLRPEAFAFSADAVWEQLNWRSYTFRINPDGSFRIEDVVPGRYDLSISLQHRDTDDPFAWPFAGYDATIQVPAVTEPHMVQPFDLGTLTLDMVDVREPAPLFEARTLDGKSARLIDYRGKHVLLHFSSPEGYGNLARLRELYKTYADRNDFQIIGLIHAESEQEAKQYVAKHRIEWPQIYLGPNFYESIAGQFHVPHVPYFVLVNPAGEIAIADLQSNKLTDTIRDLLR